MQPGGYVGSPTLHSLAATTAPPWSRWSGWAVRRTLALPGLLVSTPGRHMLAPAVVFELRFSLVRIVLRRAGPVG